MSVCRVMSQMRMDFEISKLKYFESEEVVVKECIEERSK